MARKINIIGALTEKGTALESSVEGHRSAANDFRAAAKEEDGAAAKAEVQADAITRALAILTEAEVTI